MTYLMELYWISIIRYWKRNAQTVTLFICCFAIDRGTCKSHIFYLSVDYFLRIREFWQTRTHVAVLHDHFTFLGHEGARRLQQTLSIHIYSTDRLV